jgi:N-acetylglutamate synthase-like GNAT family acetyltransferase
LPEVRLEQSLRIGPPEHSEATAIAGLLERASPNCIPISQSEIRARLHEFEVVRHQRDSVVASASVRRIEQDRCELRGLAVKNDWRGKGLAVCLVGRAVLRSLLSGLELVCVTRRPEFFAKLGFGPIPLDSLPAKPRTDETATSGGGRVAMACSLTDLARSVARVAVGS